MKTFMLIALLNGHSWVLDSGLTDDDCRAALKATVASPTLYLEPDSYVPMSEATIVCK